MSGDRLLELGAAELAERIRTCELSPVDLIERLLDHIRRHNGLLNAFITVASESSLKEAEVMEREAREGRLRGPLHGVPVAVKDLIHVRGMRFTAGSRILSDSRSESDATVVERLKSAGAIVLGKTNLHEFGSGTTNVNPHYGPCRNPWSPERISGGSSGGSAAAVAALMSPLALGTDTSGSIRIPASLCGVVGLKPTYGLVSRHGVMPLSPTLDHVGPMARSVRDVAVALEVIAGFDPMDESSVVYDVPSYADALEQDVEGLRVCLLEGQFEVPPDEEVERGLSRAVDALSRAGVEVVEEKFAAAQRVRECWAPIRLGEAAAVHDEWLRTRPLDYGEDVRMMLERGRAFTAVDYVRALWLRREIRKELLELLKRFDAVLCCSTPITAPRIGESSVTVRGESYEVYTALTSWTILFNVTGFPAVSVPVGLSREGLPISVQIAGRPFDESTLLRLARSLEQELDLRLVPPIAR
ncbi:MAG: amidase [Thaumarchaeota archaeon]|nr:amidase [Candidatus Calditenuaceae archaeon]MCX8203784.1 amidase [Nitrososphaeria archaeon]MDW8043506.1 amidase [Nitrososphaerota archaeon]